MCGIAGFYNLGEPKAPTVEMMVMWAALAQRGHDAAGAMWYNEADGKLWTYKAARASVNLVNELWQAIDGQPLRWIAFHTRQQTKGSPRNSLNNHPVKYKDTYVVHNGVISNDDEVFKALKRKRKAEVDTEAIAACLDVGGIDKAVELLQGSMSIAWANINAKDTLRLYSNGRSPLWVSEGPDVVSFASTSMFMPEGMRGAKADTLKVGNVLTLTPGSSVATDVGTGRPPPLTDYQQRVRDAQEEEGGYQSNHMHEIAHAYTAATWPGIGAGKWGLNNSPSRYWPPRDTEHYICYDLECPEQATWHTHAWGRYTFRIHRLHQDERGTL